MKSEKTENLSAQAELGGESCKKQLAEIKDSVIFQQALFDHARDSILLLEIQPDGPPVIREANAAALLMRGYSRDELIGKPISFLDAEDDPAPLNAERLRMLRNTDGAVFEVRHRRKDGSIFFAEASVKVIKINGKLMAIDISRDITERKRGEEAMRASELRYRQLFESAQNGILVLDAESGAVVEVNPALANLLGLSHVPFLNLKIWETGIFKDILADKDKFAELRKRGYVRYDNLPVTTKDGREINLEFVSSVAKADQREVIQCEVRDNTKRKAMESRQALAVAIFKCLADADRHDDVIRDILRTVKSSIGIEAVGIRLKKGEDYPYYAVEGFSDEFVIGDNHFCTRQADGELFRDTSGNVCLECMCGDVIKERTDPARPFFTKGGSFWSNCTTDLLAAKTLEQPQARMCNRCNKAGYESVALIPLRSNNVVIGLLQINDRRKNRFTLEMIEFFEGLGISIGIAVERRIVSEEKSRLEEQLRQAQKMESVGRLAGGVAHDFNNLLTAISGYAGFVFNGLDKDDPKREDIKEVLTSAERAAGLTRQLLAFSRKQILNPKSMDLNAAVGGMVRMLMRLIGEDIKLKTRLAALPCLINVDAGQIDQVLVNLAVNARDAMPKGGTLTLETGLMEPEDHFFSRHPDLPRGSLVWLSVRDTGCGMTEEAMKHIFEPFFTTKEKGKGTGLGLATVFGVIKQSGGEIEVESSPDAGTAFRIYFPYIESIIYDKDKDKDKDKDTTVSHGNEIVLLVEDDESIRRLGERVLRMSGYTAFVAADGKEAMAVVGRLDKPVDLLITDIVMPGMNGRELATELARSKLVRRVLYMSGYTDDAIVKHGVLEPGIAFIYKPFTIETFCAKLRKVLDGPADQAKA